jgi:Leucine-rich repeat (LRR) protein
MVTFLDLQSKYSPDMGYEFHAQLLKVDLSANYIESLPQQFEKLRCLRILYLHFNLLKSDSFADIVLEFH